MGKKAAVNSGFLAGQGLVDLLDGFGERVYSLRRAAGLSQTELAQQVGVNMSAVGRWETGNDLPKDPATLLRLAHVLKASVDFLLTGRVVPGVGELARQIGAELARVTELLEGAEFGAPMEARPDVVYPDVPAHTRTSEPG